MPPRASKHDGQLASASPAMGGVCAGRNDSRWLFAVIARHLRDGGG